MADKKVELKVSANVDSAISEIKKLQGAVGSAGKVGELFGSSMSAGIGQVSGALSTISGAFSGMGAMAGAALGPIALVVIAIGAVIAITKGLSAYIGEALTRTVEWGKENKKLATILGITSKEAAALNVAIDDSFTTTDAYLGAVNKLTKAIAQHPDLFRQIKVVLKESNGEYRNANEVMQDTLTAFSKMPDSLERNIAMQKAFGKSWQEVLPLLDVAQKMENARKEVEEFGLATDPAELKKYREAMDDVNDVFDYLKIAVGVNLLPVIADMLAVFGEVGKDALPAIIEGIKDFAVGLNWAWGEIKQMTLKLGALMSIFEIFTDAMGQVDLAHPIDSMGKALDNAAKRLTNLYATWRSESQATELETANRTVKIITAGTGGSDKKKPGNKPDVDDDRPDLQKFKDVLEQKKALEIANAEALGQIKQFSAKDELALLTSSAEAFKFNAKDQAQVDQMALQLKLKVHKEEYDQKMAGYDLDIAKAKGNFEKQIEIAQGRVALAKQVYGAESKEAEEATKKVVELSFKKVEEEKKVLLLKADAVQAHQKAVIALTIEGDTELRAQKLISEEELIRRKIANNEKLFQLELQGLQDRLGAAGLEPAERQKIMNEIEALQDTHTKNMAVSNNELNLELARTDGWEGARQGLEQAIEAASNSFEFWKNSAVTAANGVSDAFAGAMASVINKSKTGAQAMKSLGQALIGVFTQIATSWVKNQLIMMLTDKAATTEQTANTKQKVVANTEETGSNIGKAASGFFSANSSFPIVGAILAAAMVVLMLATMAKVTAHAVGGLIDKPTMALMGEAGPELVAPEHDFKHWANSLVMSGSEMHSQILARQASTQYNSSLAASYPRAAITATQQSKPEPGHTFHINALDPASAAKAVKEALRYHDANFG